MSDFAIGSALAAPIRVVTQTADPSADVPFVFSPSRMNETNRAARERGSHSTDSLVVEARREIAEIVREVAQAVRVERTTKQFMVFLVDRVLRAMAAEGVIAWRFEETKEAQSFVAIASLGRITTESTPALLDVAHQRLIRELAEDPQPVVVPGSPFAMDDDSPANPTQHPSAIVPIQSDPTSPICAYVLQVFLESDCSVATQRGYLRFVAQMADLAGEFLRIDGYRRLRIEQSLAAKVDDAIVRLHQATGLNQVESTIVDVMAETFGFDRVGLCYVEFDQVKLVAVSHVETIDTRSAAARQIRDAAATEMNGQVRWVWPCEAASHEETMLIRLVIAPEATSPMRLVLLNADDRSCDFDLLGKELDRFVLHAELARRQCSRRSGLRLFDNLLPRHLVGHSLRSKAILASLAVVACVCVSMIPVPLIVTASGTIRPADVQNVCASRDVVVQDIHVQHGQMVDQGDRLLTLVDTELQEQIVALVGQRAVLVQQQSRWTGAIVAAESRFDIGNHQLQSEQRLVDEEIRSIDQHLSLLRQIEESLVIRADRRGVVDSWRLEDRLSHRPLRRGDHLLQVVSETSDWLVDAKVAQKRLSHIEHALNEELTASVSLVSRPNEWQHASLVRIGPAALDDTDGQPSTIVVLKMPHDAFDTATTFRDANVQSGAPSQVTFRCGTAPAIYLLFRDVIHTVRSTAGLYLGGHDTQLGEQA